MQGFILDHRQELDSDIWMMPPLYHRVWQWMKYVVNHEDKYIPMRDGSRKLIKRGQHLTSVRDIAKDVGWYEGLKKIEPNPKTIDAILLFLVRNEMITVDRGHRNREYTLFTIINYDKYQPIKGKATTEGDEEPQVNSEKLITQQVYDHWMSKDLVKHRSLSPHIKAQISYKIGHYTSEEMHAAITAYDQILNDPAYKLSTRWGLDDFLGKGHFEKFLPDRDPFNFYPRIGLDLSMTPPAKQSKLSKNRDKLLGGAVMGHDGSGGTGAVVQSYGSLPESGRARR